MHSAGVEFDVDLIVTRATGCLRPVGTENEVFEDEAAGKVRLPIESLGRQRPVYIGKSVEGVLRHRKADELSKLFRFGFVCIRRFRSTDGRLLPLVLDPPRLLKYNALPSDLAKQVGLQQPLKVREPITASLTPVASPAAAPAIWAKDGLTGANGEVVMGGDLSGALAPSFDHRADQEYVAALRRGLRLFAIYVDAGGALCMRQTIWRRLMTLLHPDRGGHVMAFQQIAALKRQLDLGEAITIPELPETDSSSTQGDADAEALELRLREEMRLAAVAG